MTKAPPTPKGFRDILPELAKKRREVINIISNVLEESGFSPIETPTIEFAETLKGKYGEEEKLIYEFTDRGGRELALRYDLTVPLARFVTSNLNLIAKGPFRRYQIGQVFRGENPQKGRYREFTQLDFDSVGSDSLDEDAKVLSTYVKVFEKLGFKNFKVYVNDREIFSYFEREANLSDEQTNLVIRSIDKIKKISEEGVIKLLEENGIKNASDIVGSFSNIKPTERINEIFSLAKDMGAKEEKMQFMPTLARGLDYYTGTIFEVEIKDYKGGSVAGGGRYDNLIGLFAKRKIPAVGGSFGIDRLIEAME